MVKLKTKCHSFRKGRYYIHIFEDSQMWECYIQEKSYGIITLMFSLPKEQTKTIDEVINIVNHNFDYYQLMYEEQYEE